MMRCAPKNFINFDFVSQCSNAVRRAPKINYFVMNKLDFFGGNFLIFSELKMCESIFDFGNGVNVRFSVTYVLVMIHLDLGRSF